MKRSKASSLLALVTSFFEGHLRNVLGASEHTVRAYGDALRLFFLFLADHVNRPVASLQLDDIRAESVLAFLHHIESTRGNSAATRNSRLAALRSFTEHLMRQDIARVEEYGRILAIPTKRAVHRSIEYLEPEDARAMIAAVQETSPAARRDRALLLLLYNTGARVSEAISVRPRDLQLTRPRQVRLHGKGGKERVCPLWAETAVALRTLPLVANLDEPIFRNARGAPLTRDGVAYIVAKYVRNAAKTRRELRGRHITPHILRHSCAVGLLQAGVDISVIRDFLGHATIATTSRYISTNLETKREVLQAFWNRAGLDSQSAARWRPSSKLIAFLSSL